MQRAGKKMIHDQAVGGRRAGETIHYLIKRGRHRSVDRKKHLDSGGDSLDFSTMVGTQDDRSEGKMKFEMEEHRVVYRS